MKVIEEFINRYTNQQREQMSPSGFALPDEKKYPIITKNDVMNSIRGFHNCPDAKKKELARNLIKAAKKHGINIKDPNILRAAGQPVQEKTMNVGEEDFPLIIDTDEDVHLNHELVGKQAQITEYAENALTPYKGKMCTIEGVIIQVEQLVGYKIKTLDERVFYCPKKDVYVFKQFVEDIFQDARHAMRAFEAVRHWTLQRDYFGPSWDGLELLCLNLATVVQSAAVETAGWFKYPSSTRTKMDGKNWRYVFKIGEIEHGVVNCNSLLHDNVWTLVTTTYSTKDIDRNKLTFFHHEDIWVRSIMWAIATAKLLQDDNYNYSNIIQDFNNRLQLAEQVTQLIDQVKPIVIQAHEQITGKECHLRNKPLVAAVTKILLSPGKIGEYVPSNTYHAAFISVHPKAFRDSNYVNEIVKHELVHAALETECNEKNDNSEEFKQLMGALNG